MGREGTCAERIGEQLADRLEQFREIDTREERASFTGNEEKRERAMEERYELPLAVTRSTVWRIDLSTGGPGDWFEIHVDDEQDVTRVEYHFNDWFDHASVTLERDDFDTVETFARAICGDFYIEQPNGQY